MYIIPNKDTAMSRAEYNGLTWGCLVAIGHEGYIHNSAYSKSGYFLEMVSLSCLFS